MWTSERRARATRAAHAALAALLASCLATPAAGAQTVRLVGGALDFGTVLPGGPPVVVAPWTTDLAQGRTAPVFEISGAPGEEVRVQFPGLAASIRNPGNGALLTVDAYSGSYSIVNGPAGATSFTPTPSPTRFVLGPDGRGYVSIGARASATPTQAKGTYTQSGGTAIKVQ